MIHAISYGHLAKHFWAASHYKHTKTKRPNSMSHYSTTPDLTIATRALGVPERVPSPSILFTRSIPSITSPNTTCLPFNQGVAIVVMKNCEPFLSMVSLSSPNKSRIPRMRIRNKTYVFLPALAMLSWPGFVCLSSKFSSGNVLP